MIREPRKPIFGSELFSEKLLEVIKDHTIKSSEFRMTLTVNPCHGNRDDSKNGPGWTLADIHPL